MRVKEKIIEIKDIGPVLFVSSSRAKRLNISIRPYRGVRVAVPKEMGLKEAKKMVQAKISWIAESMQKIKAFEKENDGYIDFFKGINTEEARKILSERLEYLSSIHGFSYNKVTIRNQKTRWGSCSSKNNISLNQKLIRLPQELIDYVLLHELVHTRIKNHGKEFWSEMDILVGNAKRLDKKLSQFKIRHR